MITNVSLVTLYVTDQDEAKRFYVDVLGFVEGTDVDDGRRLPLGDGRAPGPPRARGHADGPRARRSTRSMAGAVRRVARQRHHGRLRPHHRRLPRRPTSGSAKLGVEFVQQPAERPYGVEAVMRDNSGNWLVLVEPKPYTGEDFPHA